MSRLDYFTIGVVAVCIMAIVFLLYQTTDLFKFGDQTENTSISDQSNSSFEEDYYDDEEIADYENYYEEEVADATTEEADYDTGGDIEEEEAPIETYEETTTATQTKPTKVVDIDMPSAGGDFLVLAGSFEYKHNAQIQAKKLQGMGYSAAEVVSFNRGKYASVLVNRFESESEARQLVAKLKKDGVSCYVHKKR